MWSFFRKKPAAPAAPLVYAPVERLVHIAAPADAVRAHLATYSGLWGSDRAQTCELGLATADGRTVLRLPDAVHPWQLHNLACWMLDCDGLGEAGVLARSAAGPDHPAYALVRDPEQPDWLCGWDDEGAGWSVHVPSNQLHRGEPVPVPRPLPAPAAALTFRPVAATLEDPGPAHNERLLSTAQSRADLLHRTTGRPRF